MGLFIAMYWLPILIYMWEARRIGHEAWWIELKFTGKHVNE
jgi:hypothetical protein